MCRNASVSGEGNETELLVFIKVKDLCSYILFISGKSPAKYRFSLLNPLISGSLELLELLYQANDLTPTDINRLQFIGKAKTRLKTIIFDASRITTIYIYYFS